MNFLPIIVPICSLLAVCLSSQVIIKISGIVGEASRAHFFNRRKYTNQYETGNGDGVIEFKFIKSDETSMLVIADGKVVPVGWHGVTRVPCSEIEVSLTIIQSQIVETLNSGIEHLQCTYGMYIGDFVTFIAKAFKGEVTIEALVTE